MVTVVKRPTGHKLIDQPIPASITDSSGDALITFPYHGLDTGDTVYITSDIDEYNGFWFVTVIDVNSFKISELEGQQGTLIFTPFVLVPFTSWGISNTSAEPMAWTGGAAPFLTVSSGVSVGGLSDFFGPTGVSFEDGQTYKYSFQFTYSHTVAKSLRIRIQVTDSFFVVLTEQINPLSATSTPQVFSGEFEFVCPVGAVNLGIVIDYPTGTSEAGLVEFDSFTDLTEDVYSVEANFVEFYQELDIDYYQTQIHDWNSIFLPIIYKVLNDKWPTNSVDSANLIVLNSDDNGFTSLTLAAPFSANALEFLKISGASTAEANGVWQIVEVVTTNVIVINLPFELSGNLTGAAAQYYYNNYQVKVKVFAGLPVAHPWEPKKPFVEVAELSLTPDEDNIVMFSIADYIKMKVAIKNNLTLFSLPLNLDAFTGFFISTAESYDLSDNYSLYTSESSFTTDDFEGYAIAGKLEFKNVYSGDYADFVYTSGSPARWLTNRSRLLSVEGYYFDISFIKNVVGAFIVGITKYLNDYGTLEEVEYADQGIGVYRIPITPDANYDSFCVQVRTLGTPGSGGEVVPVEDFPAISTFTNSGTGDDWVISATPSVNVVSTTSKFLRSAPYAFEVGVEYTVSIEYTKIHNSGSGVVHEIALRVTEISNGTLFQTIEDTTTGSDSGTVILIFTAPSIGLPAERINIEVNDSSNVTVTIDSFTITTVSPVIPGTTGATVTEEICIDMLEVCVVQDGFVSTEGIRLLEDGGYRLLE